MKFKGYLGSESGVVSPAGHKLWLYASNLRLLDSKGDDAVGRTGILNESSDVAFACVTIVWETS